MPRTDKRAAPRLTGEQAVERLVDATIRLLAEEGPSEIKARSVAEAAQVSTVAVYYHLGGLPELFQAVVDKGFRDLDRAFEALHPSNDPAADLFAMALVNRRLAQENPHLYDLMFGLSTRGSYRPLQDAPSAPTRSETFQKAYGHLVQACHRCVTSGRIRAHEDAEKVASQLWSCVHGFTTLELGGHFAQFSNPVLDVMGEMAVNIIVGLGDNPERARTSYACAVAEARLIGDLP
jgi:AcrR family transcriptional regulator